jgi:hypothetical protein
VALGYATCGPAQATLGLKDVAVDVSLHMFRCRPTFLAVSNAGTLVGMGHI